MSGARHSRAVRWQSRVRSAFAERVPLKATALFLAFVLWVITSTREETEELMGVRFVPGLDGTLELAGDPPQVRALVRGLGREVLKLHQSPPVIRRTVAGDLPDTITIELRPADVDLPPGVDARVLDVRPRTVTLAFRPVISRAVPVRSGLVVRPDRSGRVAAGLHFDPESVTVVGPRRGVARVRWIRTVDDTLPSREGVSHVVRLDTAGLRAMGVRAQQATVRVRITRLGRSEDAYGEAEPTYPAAAQATPPRREPPADSMPPDSVRAGTPRDSGARAVTPRDSAARDTTRPRKDP